MYEITVYFIIVSFSHDTKLISHWGVNMLLKQLETIQSQKEHRRTLCIPCILWTFCTEQSPSPSGTFLLESFPSCRKWTQPYSKSQGKPSAWKKSSALLDSKLNFCDSSWRKQACIQWTSSCVPSNRGLSTWAWAGYLLGVLSTENSSSDIQGDAFFSLMRLVLSNNHVKGFKCFRHLCTPSIWKSSERQPPEGQ